MATSSCFTIAIDGFTALERGPDHRDPATCAGDESLAVMRSLAALAVAEGHGEGSTGDDGAEGASVEAALESLVAPAGAAPACAPPGSSRDGRETGGGSRRVGRAEAPGVSDTGEELCREHHPHRRQRAEFGVFGPVCEQGVEITLDPADPLRRVERLRGEASEQLGGGRFSRLDDPPGPGGLRRGVDEGARPARRPRLSQAHAQAGLSGAPYPDRRGIARAHQVWEVERLPEARVDAAEKPEQARDAPRLVPAGLAPATELEPERAEWVVVRRDRAQRTAPHEITGGTPVARIGLALAPLKGLTGRVQTDNRRLNRHEALDQQGCLENAGREAPRVGPGHHLWPERPRPRGTGDYDIRVSTATARCVAFAAYEPTQFLILRPSHRHRNARLVSPASPNKAIERIASSALGQRRRYRPPSLPSHRGQSG